MPNPPHGSQHVIERIEGDHIPSITVLRDTRNGDFTIRITLPKGFEMRSDTESRDEAGRVQIEIATYPPENE